MKSKHRVFLMWHRSQLQFILIVHYPHVSLRPPGSVQYLTIMPITDGHLQQEIRPLPWLSWISLSGESAGNLKITFFQVHPNFEYAEVVNFDLFSLSPPGLTESALTLGKTSRDIP